MYNKGDSTWMDRPKIMDDHIFFEIIDKIKKHSLEFGQPRVKITFHGGEPLLVGAEKLENWCDYVKKKLEGIMEISFTLQTNGLLINDRFIEIFKKYKFQIGVSIDGPKKIHDTHRVYHSGKGSYDNTIRKIKLLQQHAIPFGILSVIPLGEDPIQIHDHFVGLGIDSVHYLLPDFTNDDKIFLNAAFGETPCAEFLIPLFDYWWFNNDSSINISIFRNIIRTILGGYSRSDSIGNAPLNYVVVETDGEIEGLDCLRICQNGITKSGLNIIRSEFIDLKMKSSLHERAIFTGVKLADKCINCPEGKTCSGGYLPHRFSKENQFDNPSVWCEDLLKIYAHIRNRLGVDIDETQMRKTILKEMMYSHVLAS
jgi:uncharacterized protein